MLYDDLRFEIFPISEPLYLNIKVRLRLIRTRQNFYMISYNPSFGLGIVERSP